MFVERPGRGNREIRFFGVFRPSPPLHFYLLQFVGFAYFLYRFASRSYTAYGHVPDDLFRYQRSSVVLELWPVPLLHFTSLQFIYAVLPRPTPQVIAGLQIVIVLACLCGLAGLAPRWSALAAFVLGLHVTGLMQSSNSELDGGTLALCSMLILALSPRESFYRAGKSLTLSRRHPDYHWPLFLLLMVVGVYYTTAGLNKIVDIGPHWPFVLHLDRLAERGIERSLFVASRFAAPSVAALHRSALLSSVAGVITLAGELFFITVLILPRYRLFFVVTAITLHVLVFLMAGINFVGSSAILLLCLDWNVLVRRATLSYDPASPIGRRAARWATRFGWLGRLVVSPIESPRPQLPQALRLVDESGEVYDGVDALEQAAARCPVWWPFALLMKVPGVAYAARYIYGTTTTGNARAAS